LGLPSAPPTTTKCHGELLHNPVFTLDDIARLRTLVAQRGLDEDDKPPNRLKLAGRTQLLHEVIAAGIKALIDGDTPD
jgi:hypothetical protein